MKSIRGVVPRDLCETEHQPIAIGNTHSNYDPVLLRVFRVPQTPQNFWVAGPFLNGRAPARFPALILPKDVN